MRVHMSESIRALSVRGGNRHQQGQVLIGLSLGSFNQGGHRFFSLSMTTEAHSTSNASSKIFQWQALLADARAQKSAVSSYKWSSLLSVSLVSPHCVRKNTKVRQYDLVVLGAFSLVAGRMRDAYPSLWWTGCAVYD